MARWSRVSIDVSYAHESKSAKRPGPMAAPARSTPDGGAETAETGCGGVKSRISGKPGRDWVKGRPTAAGCRTTGKAEQGRVSML